MTDQVFIGIDPGKKGAAVFLCDDIAMEYVVPMIKGKAYDIPAMVKLLKAVGAARQYVALEKVHAMPGQGVTSMFSFGTGWGIWQGILAALEIPYILVTPQQWQKTICAGLSGDSEARAQQAAQMQIPKLNLRPGRCRKPHDGVAAAACLALYARWYFGREQRTV